jgi:hypothetical protein
MTIIGNGVFQITAGTAETAENVPGRDGGGSLYAGKTFDSKPSSFSLRWPALSPPENSEDLGADLGAEHSVQPRASIARAKTGLWDG